MEHKAANPTTVLTTEARSVLRSTKTLSAEEERVLRMHYGAGVDLNAPLQNGVAGDGGLLDELAVLELQLFRAQRERQVAARTPRTSQRLPPLASNRAKERIVRALRKKR